MPDLGEARPRFDPYRDDGPSAINPYFIKSSIQRPDKKSEVDHLAESAPMVWGAKKRIGNTKWGKIDWSSVDWSKTDEDLSRTLERCVSWISRMRNKHFKK